MSDQAMQAAISKAKELQRYGITISGDGCPYPYWSVRTQSTEIGRTYRYVDAVKLALDYLYDLLATDELERGMSA